MKSQNKLVFLQFKFIVMGIFMFHRPEMPKFNYIPRYYDPEKEALEKKKAAMGLDSNLSDNEKFRVRMKKSWGRLDDDGNDARPKSTMGRLRIYIILGISAFFVYILFFTPFVEDFIKSFLSMGGK